MGRKEKQIPLVKAGLMAGLVLFAAATLRQVGINTPPRARAGFITGLYVVLVPMLGLLFRQRTNIGTWLRSSRRLWSASTCSVSPRVSHPIRRPA